MIITSQPFKVGDWVILKNEYIEITNKRYPPTIRYARRVISVEQTFYLNHISDIRISNTRRPLYTHSKYYRLATDLEIKKEKLKTIFKNVK